MGSDIRISIVLPYFERPDVLAVSLRSFQALYSNLSTEIIIVDDGSRPDLAPKLPNELTIPTKIVLIQPKDGINPCTPINVGAIEASGNFLLLSSPETVHTESIHEALNNADLARNESWFFSVFALTDERVNSELLHTDSHLSFMEFYSTFANQLGENLGFQNYSWANSLGSWYSHPVHRRTDLNFLSLIRRDSFFSIGGFDERYRHGSGFDDNEFRRRMLSRGFLFTYVGHSPAIHLIHDQVSTRSDINIGINSNEWLYKSPLMRMLPRKSVSSSHPYMVELYNYD